MKFLLPFAVTLLFQLCHGDESDVYFPILDFSQFLSGDESAKQGFIDELNSALTGPGFFYLKNHGVPASVIEKTFDLQKKFFDLPLDEKMAKPADRSIPWGYGADQTENFIDRPDHKEVFDFNAAGLVEQRWGDDPFFKDSALNEIALTLHNAILDVFRAYAVALGADEYFFVRRINKYAPDIIGGMRWAHYPPLPEDAHGTLCGSHTDYVPLVILFQDDVGGLEAWDRKEKRWVTVTPIPGAMTINTGDMMQRWSNGKFYSSVHQVSYKSHSNTTSRNSFLYYLSPNGNSVIDPRDVFPDEPEENIKYAPLNVGNFFVSRVQAMTSTGENESGTEYGDTDAVDEVKHGLKTRACTMNPENGACK